MRNCPETLTPEKDRRKKSLRHSTSPTYEMSVLLKGALTNLCTFKVRSYEISYSITTLYDFFPEPQTTDIVLPSFSAY